MDLGFCWCRGKHEHDPSAALPVPYPPRPAPRSGTVLPKATRGGENRLVAGWLSQQTDRHLRPPVAYMALWSVGLSILTGIETTWNMTGKYQGQVSKRESIRAQDLFNLILSQRPPHILDVRSRIEFRNGHISGAKHAPVWRLLLRLTLLPADRSTEMVVTCAHGPRAILAKILLRAQGYNNVAMLAGHMTGWRQAGLPLERLP